jgi:hypothetical protein
MGRNYLKGPEGDRINAVLAAAGYNFCLLLRWLAALLRLGLFRTSRDNAVCHCSRKADQGMAAGMEDRADREGQPPMARSVPRFVAIATVV